MHIAEIAPLAESVPPSHYGGTERVVSWLSDELVSLGEKITLFASGGGSGPQQRKSSLTTKICYRQSCHDHFLVNRNGCSAALARRDRYPGARQRQRPIFVKIF